MNELVLMHRGDSYYLKYCIESIKKNSPNFNINLLIENSTQIYDNINQKQLLKYSKYVQELEKIYKHKSSVPPILELFCIKRWFVLLDFMEQNNLKQVMTFDSDVLVTSNLMNDLDYLKSKDVWLAREASAGFTYISDINVLREYRKIVLDFYDNKFDSDKSNSITDMSFWKVLKENNIFNVGEITDINLNGVYDAGILLNQNGCVMKKGMKKIYFINGKPHGYMNNFYPNDYLFIPFKILHFQAGTKFYMKYYLEGKNNIIKFHLIKLKLIIRNNLTGIMGNKTRKIVKKIMLRVL